MSRDMPDMPIGMLQKSAREPRRVPPPPQSIRLPADLQEHLKQCADANCRSLNKEILFRLQESAAGESIGEHGEIVRQAVALNK